MREWLVIEDSRSRGVFVTQEQLTPKGYIPRDVAEELLGRSMEGAQWFTHDESARLRASSHWRDAFADEPVNADLEYFSWFGYSPLGRCPTCGQVWTDVMFAYDGPCCSPALSGDSST